MRICLPISIKSDFDGYQCLIDIYNEVLDAESDTIDFSFQNTKWFEANLAAGLGAIVELIENKGKKVIISDIRPQQQDILQRNGFLQKYGYSRISHRSGTIVSYQTFKPNADNLFRDYIRNELLSKPDFPTHSRLLGKKITESIFELYENARTHGRCRQAHTCGQYYPNKNPKRLDITIVDMGNTIKTNVNEFLQQPVSGAKAIDWAVQKGNTTKTGKISGGLGLSIIFEFIELNKGKIQIVSSDGYWEYRKGETLKKDFNGIFPGTIANIEFNLDDRSSYRLKNEVSLDDIF